MTETYAIRDYIGRFQSNYLCKHCGQPLYTPNAHLKDDVCLTDGCPNCLLPTLTRIAVSEENAPLLFRQLEDQQQKLESEIAKWDWASLARSLAKARRDVFRSSIDAGTCDMEAILSIGELLLTLNTLRPNGALSSISSLEYIIKQVREIRIIRNFIDDCRTRRHLMVRSRIMAHENNGFFPLTLKYLGTHYTDMKAAGLVSKVPSVDASNLFLYEDIDFSDMNIEVRANEEDAARMFESLVPTSLQLDRLFKANLRTSEQYKHNRNPYAMSVLMGWYLKTTDSSEVYLESDPELAASLTAHFRQVGSEDYTGEAFLEEFVESKTLVPFGVRIPDGILLDKMTLLFMMIYIYAQPVPPYFIRTAGYSSALNAYTTSRSNLFVNWLEERLRYAGLAVPIKNQEFAADGERHEYDLIIVDESDKTILLVEAKYRNVAQSSVTGINLVKNELEGKRGLIYEAVRHDKRLAFFEMHTDKFEPHLCLVHDVDMYQVKALIVTKSTPILSRLDRVELVEAMDFLSLSTGRDASS